MTDKTIRWGMIGCGGVTEAKSAPAYQLVDGFELVAVMCRHLEKAMDYADRHNIPKYYSDAAALINDEEVDAIYIATPPDSHLKYALMVAEAGKTCCVEKPMAVCYDDTFEMLQAFKSRNLKLFVAYYRRCLPRFVQVKQWLDDGEIGDVRCVNWMFFKPASSVDTSGEYNWRTDAEIAPGGYFDDLASHGLDLIVYLLGNIKSVAGFAENQCGLYTAKDAIVASWVHESGVMGSGNWNFNCGTSKDKLEIVGEKGRITLSVFHDAPCVLETNGKKNDVFIEHPNPVQLPFVKMIRDDLFGNGCHVSLGDSGCHTSWVMSRILGG
jgi:predicted dehydrogenase